MLKQMFYGKDGDKKTEPQTSTVALEGTTTFSPIPETTDSSPAEPATSTPDKKSGGFVNVAILLVVLVVVTIVSIELGKFLFSVYGAK